jgi:DNA-binding response OmpR family regulator
MQILLVEDDLGLSRELQVLLEAQLYTVSCAHDGNLALDLILGQEFDLILLDLMLPQLDGFGVLRALRQEGIQTPVLILTARDAIPDRIQGLDSGADDYLTKPFSAEELLARVRALLRRGTASGSALLSEGPLSLDTVRREAQLNQQVLALTPIEFRLLEFLFYNKGRAVSRFNLAEHVWGSEFDPFTMSNSLEVHIKNLRHKLGDQAALLVTVRGTGYMLSGSQT